MIRWLRALLVGVALISSATGPTTAQGSDFEFEIWDSPRPIPDLRFTDAAGRILSLGDFRGELVLLNIWATWCPPCREELPTLERLQGEMDGSRFQVIALSTDTGRLEDVQNLYDELGLDDAGIFVDETGSAMRDLGVFGLPTTLLIGAQGQELGRSLGPAVWDRKEALAFFRDQIARTDKRTLEPLD